MAPEVQEALEMARLSEEDCDKALRLAATLLSEGISLRRRITKQSDKSKALCGALESALKKTVPSEPARRRSAGSASVGLDGSNVILDDASTLCW